MSTQRLSLRKKLALAALIAAAIATPRAAQAQLYWDNNGTTAGFGTAGGNWDGAGTGNLWNSDSTGVLAVTPDYQTLITDNLNFGTATDGLATGPIAVSGTVDAGSMTFGTASGNITFTGGTINMAATTTIDTTDNTIWYDTTVLSGGTTSVTKNGTGILRLSGANAAVTGGDFFVNAGTLRISNTSTAVSGANALGGADGWTVQLGDTSGTATATLQLANSINLPNNIVVRAGSSGTKTIGNSGNIAPTFSGVITANDSVTIQNSGNAALNVNNGANSIADTKIVRFNTTGTGALNNAATWSGMGSVTYTGNDTGNTVPSTLNTYSGGTTLGTQTSTGAVVPSVSSTGTPNFPSAGPFGTGLLTIGDTRTRSTNAAPTTIHNTISFAGNPTFITTGSEENYIFTGDASLGATRTLTSDVGSTIPGTFVEFSGAISGVGFGITKAGTGTLKLSGTNTYDGATTISRGTLDLDFSTATAPTANIISSSSALSMSGGLNGTARLTLTGKASTSNSQTFNGLTLTDGVNTIAANANVTANPLLVALGAITRTGGAVDFVQPTGTINANNGFTTSNANNANGILGGWATVDGTGWATNNGTNIVALSSYTLTSVAGTNASNYTSNHIDVDNSAGTLSDGITPATLRFSAAAANTLTLSPGISAPAISTLGTGGILVSSTVGANVSTITGGALAGTASGELVVNQHNTASNLTIASVIANNGGATALTKAGAGTLTLTGANTYTGATNNGAGILQIGGTGTLGAGSFPANIHNYSGNITNNGTLQYSSSTTQIFSGIISGPGGLTKNTSNSSVLVLSGANDYTGATTISNGTLMLGDGGTTGTLSPSSAISISSGATLAFNRSNTITQGTGFESTITGQGGITLVGTGTVTLNEGNPYTGTTRINEGTLVLNFNAGTAPANNIIAAASPLAMGGGQLTLTGTASTTTSQTFADLALTGGANTIANNANATANPQLLALGAITRSVGSTINFSLPTGTQGATNGITTSNTVTNDIIGGWATVGNANWAAKTGSNITAFSGYTLTSVAGTTAANYTDLNISVDNSAGLIDNTITPNSLHFNTAGAFTMTLAAGDNIVGSGGILVGSTVGNVITTITGGNLAGSASGDLIIHQNNTNANASRRLIISSIIKDNGGATALTKSGVGRLSLAGISANTYTGDTFVNGGTLSLEKSANTIAIPGNLIVRRGGTLLTTVAASNQIADTASLTFESGSAFSAGIVDTVGAVTVTGPGTSFNPGSNSNFSMSSLTLIGTTGGTSYSLAANAGNSTMTIGAGGLTMTGAIYQVAQTTGTDTAKIVLNGNFTSSGDSQLTAGGSTQIAQLDLGASTRTFDVTETMSIAPIVIGAGGGLTKINTGTLTLSATNTYSGDTTINGGTLAVTGSLANNGPANILMATPDTTLLDNPIITRRIPIATSYTLGSATGLGSTAVSMDPGVSNMSMNTTAAILGGTATGQTDVSMQWRARTASEANPANVNAVLSNVLELSGIFDGGTPSDGILDTFVLQMSYTDAALGSLNEMAIANSGELRLGWNDNGVWKSAFLGNNNGTGTGSFVGIAEYDPMIHTTLGMYGVYPDNNVVWAVLNHNSEFAVIPEPSTLVFGGLALLGLAGAGLRKRRLAKMQA